MMPNLDRGESIPSFERAVNRWPAARDRRQLHSAPVARPFAMRPAAQRERYAANESLELN